ncbi:MAG: PASTA domain-containing protein [Bacteroidales bacterium]|nr:PASTA domain-containing protein [Bacteroidales bacterium]
MSTQDSERRRASNFLTFFHALFLVASVLIVIEIVKIQYFWEPDPRYVEYFQPKKDKKEIEPLRGSIIDHNGKLLALSTPMYQVHMDCYVLKEAHDGDKEKGEEKEEYWIAQAEELAKALPSVLCEEGKDEAYYKDLIFTGRRLKKRYVSIAKDIDHGTLEKLKALPLFCKGQYTSGMIVEKEETRQYPYEGLARRVIGYVRHNNDTNAKLIGIEGKYDYILHGKHGLEWQKVTDTKVMIPDVDSSVVDVTDGSDIRTTLDIDIQDIADKALRENVAVEEDITGGCVVVMEVGTGAIRAMVNLQKDKKGELREVFNMAAGRPAEPGSVFKTVTLTTLIEDGHIGLEDRIRTNRGRMEDMSRINPDDYIVKYENRTGNNTISVVEGFEISSNYVFRRLAKDYYGGREEQYFNRLHEYNFGEAYEFDLTETGSAKPSIPDVKTSPSPLYDLVSVAIGYSARVTPLQVVTFYNAIANNGKMMKPYIVESIEKDGRTQVQFKPEILNGSICSKATADTVTRALKMVTAEGTAKNLRNAKCTVAGKTGTSRMHLSVEERNGSGKPYEDNLGRKKHQATFVGFFPADEPKYTAIVVLYTGLIHHNVYGGSIPAKTFKDIVDGVWAHDTCWGEELKERAEVPQMRADHISTTATGDSPVPDVTGFGLKDAVFALENNGYRCTHKGSGHVVSQSPEAGVKMKKGTTVNITLK